MANDYLGLAESLLINDSNNADIDVSDILDAAPVLRQMSAVEASNGDIHKYLKYTGMPVVGFRSVNDGREHDHSEDTQVTVTLEILDASFTVDKALADSSRLGPEGLVRREAIRHLRAAFAQAEKQVLHGTNNAAAGFAGLDDAMASLAGESHSARIHDADSGNSGSNYTSVYLIRNGVSDCSFVLGNGMSITIDETGVQRVAGATGYYTAYHTPITVYTGLQLGGLYSIQRIANITTGGAGVTLTDDIIFDALADWPTTAQPNMIVMGVDPLEQLRASRTATNATGAPAPIPTEVAGIPIIATDQISTSQTWVTT